MKHLKNFRESLNEISYFLIKSKGFTTLKIRDFLSCVASKVYEAKAEFSIPINTIDFFFLALKATLFTQRPCMINPEN